MAIKELLSKLSYSKCECPVDYREELGIVNGVCPNHSNSVLMLDGVIVEAYRRYINGKKFDRKTSEIV